MKNINQCPSGLIYNGLSIVYLHSFSIGNKVKFDDQHVFVETLTNSIDHQIFNLQGLGDEKLICRYKLKGFRTSIKLEDNGPEINGYVHVEASLFFNNTVCISYRLVIDSTKDLDWDHEGFCESSTSLNTDELIALAGIPLATEHWSQNGDLDCSDIDNDVESISISELYLDESTNWLDIPVEKTGKKEVFLKVLERYKFLFTKSNSESSIVDPIYVFIDVWENVGHQQGISFAKMAEDEIIEHIENHHQSEMIGLLTLYPYEWPYRLSSDFEEICGKNIAIDTDDLVLANQNICIVFGTYGLRGKDSPTDWKEHLAERAKYHVSWPEYLLIVEMIIAKKQAINNALSHFINNTIKVSRQKNTRKLIEENALLTLEISNTLLKLDAVRFSRFVSHKIMYERTEKRLGLERDYNQLQNAISQIDQSLNNVTNSREIKQANLLNLILGIISVASLFSILLTPAELPFFKAIAADERLAFNGGVTIIILTFLLIFLSVVFGAFRLIRTIFYRK
ncbi:hypothetical protein [Labilibaculum sp.]|uniref:hypothetical protein n=1 Tax=Labilibaculum sp. TaxID=2060723 RepID=UPI002AA74631|nr:hypothetical protein [Labilibaculum sp.]